MPTKGMRSPLFHTKTASSAVQSSPSRHSVSFPTPLRIPVTNFTDTMIEETIGKAAILVMKWNTETSTYAKVTSLLYESKTEARQFIRCVTDLQKVMHFLVLEDPTSEKLVHSQGLMQVAMKRLQKEFYQILSMNRAHLDPESISTRSRSSRAASSRSSTSDYNDATTDDDVKFAGETISQVEQVSSTAMADLKSIAECMISSGYAKECVHIYNIIRKSIVDEEMYKLRVEKWSSSQIAKLDREVLDRRIQSWLNGMKVSISTLFNGERILCDHVFASSAYIRELCFSQISREAASILFGFPQFLVEKTTKSSTKRNNNLSACILFGFPQFLVAKTTKSSSKRNNNLLFHDVFRLLDMYTSISEHWQEIDSIFGCESTSTVRSEALTSLIKLGESVRGMISDFESAIQKDSSKSVAPGGGVHDLTLRVMNYLSILTDYSAVLADIFANWSPPANSLMPEWYFDYPSSDNAPAPAIVLRVAWLVLVLVCKLDDKAKHYKDVPLSYLFLANNLQHVIARVRTSNLQYLLGEDWISKQEAKVRQFAANYEQLAWGKVVNSFPENPTADISPGEGRLIFRDELKSSVAKNVAAVYTGPAPSFRMP